MFGYFYHGTTRTIQSIFGNLFKDIHVLRKNQAGDTIQDIKVPIIYGPKHRWYYRITQDPNLGDVRDDDAKTQNPVQNVVPAMSYEMTGIDYVADKKLPQVGKQVKVKTTDNTVLTRTFNPVPVVYTFDLHIITKYHADGLQILEQILPWFTPDFSVSIVQPGMDFKKDVKITLQYPIKPEEEWEGDFTKIDSVTWSLTFHVEADLYGPIKDQGIIRHANIRLTPDPDVVIYDEFLVKPVPETVNPDEPFDVTYERI
jgi:hypothetical protein